MTVGDRLRLERERLDLSAAITAEIGAVSRTVQYSYEKNMSKPDTGYLARVAEVGFDVLYIITGTRRSDPKLKPDEAALLDNYRHSSEEGRQAIQATSDLLSQQQKPKKRKVA